MNLSPTLNECPSLAILKSLILNNVEPIPTEVVAELTSTFNNKLEPVSVVAPMPNLETPMTGKFSYIGSGINSLGLKLPLGYAI